MKKLEGVDTVTWKAEVTEVPPPPISKELKRRWSYFIQKVYETDPQDSIQASFTFILEWEYNFLQAPVGLCFFLP